MNKIICSNCHTEYDPEMIHRTMSEAMDDNDPEALIADGEYPRGRHKDLKNKKCAKCGHKSLVEEFNQPEI